jgi:hypothetical protein
MPSHRPEDVKIRLAYPPHRACRNTSCWCWSSAQLDMRTAQHDLPHLNGGNPPPYTIDGKAA